MESTLVENLAINVQNNVLKWLLVAVLQPVNEPVALKAIFFKASTDSGQLLNDPHTPRSRDGRGLPGVLSVHTC